MRRPHARRLATPAALAAGAALAVAATLVAVPTPTAAAAPTCAGREATFVGRPDQLILSGTSGPDVIVSGGAFSVDARGGDDLVCATGSTNEVSAGGGGDDVRSSVTRGSGEFSDLEVDLGSGADRFTGSAASEFVNADAVGFDTDQRDVVVTGAGDDHVGVGEDLVDDIDLGPGDDDVSLFGRVLGEGGRLEGGTGTDRIFLPHAFDPAESLSRADWMVDNRLEVGVATADGVAVLSWTSFEAFDLIAAARSYSFVGSDRDESFSARALESAVMGGGDDEVRPDHRMSGVTYDGGPGADVLDLDLATCTGTAYTDLGAGTYRCERRGAVDRIAFPLFESVRVDALRGTVRGTPRADGISLSACRGEVLGLGGADRLMVGIRYRDRRDDERCEAVRRPVRLLGGGGTDVLRGSPFDDALLGGPGRDNASGARGDDRCVAERRVRCER